MGSELSFAGLRDDEFAIGLDVGGTKTLGVAVDRDGSILATTTRVTEVGETGVVDTIEDAVAALALQLPALRPASIGIGVPGLVDSRTGSVGFAVNVRLENSPLAELVRKRTGLSSAVENDVAVAALGENLRAADSSSLAVISIGTGLAVGIVSGGEVARGAAAAAGEIGHLVVEPEGPHCGCGQRGCLELYLSGSGIARMWPEGGPGAAALLASAVADGDGKAREVLAVVVSRLAWAIQLLALTVAPERILLSGGVMALGDVLLTPLRERLTEQAAASPFVSSLALDARVHRGSGAEAAALGAALRGISAHAPLLVT